MNLKRTAKKNSKVRMISVVKGLCERVSNLAFSSLH